MLQHGPQNKPEPQEPRFSLGRVVSTPGALEAMQQAGVDPRSFLDQHARGAWGDLPPEDVRANEQALITGERLLSRYVLPDERILWLITDAEDDAGVRQATTFLLPEEY